ncbi:MAG: hypothetical protein GOVbin4162_57 [Prokaryotic dsDNA virus sp.]|nr:MAG: hypothetical protein GOVbin4162_57 [Prokaryotic dsDNA virus sp.]|tara:strand:- start:4338 stop:4832 length:495 start_codon:yes stop_codon:yes gene_type:complete
MKIIQGNLIDAFLNGDVDYMFHCCNCQNNFGSGIAKEVRERIPEAYEADTVWDKALKGDTLGTFSFAPLYLRSGVFNLYGQEYYGIYGEWFKQNGRQLHYGAYVSALTAALDRILLERGSASYVTLGFPYKIGSDRAGGVWEEVRMITESIVESYEFNLVWYKL